MTLITSVINGLRDLRLDLFRHLETRPSSFYDRVAVGRLMTRVTNDIEALYELLRGVGTLIGEFVPFFVALTIMLAIDVPLTLILLLVLPVMGTVTYYFRQATRQLFRMVRMTVSSLNQNLQENLAGLQVVQLSDRQRQNLERYTRINKENQRWELKSARLETIYGAFTDSMAQIALGAIIWYGGGAGDPERTVARGSDSLHPVHRHAVPARRGPGRADEHPVQGHGLRRTHLPGPRLGRNHS